MIVTRKRRKRRNLLPLLLPLVAIGLLAAALTWPPSRNVIENGPLRPVWTVASNVAATLGRPLTFAAQQQQITDKNRQIRDLDAQLDKARADKAAAEQRSTQLQQQMAAQAAQPRSTPLPRPVAKASAAAGSAGTLAAAPAGSAGPPATDDEKRLAATWAAMDPEKAAAVVQRMPDDQAVRVLDAMDPESAAGILNALPPAVAARLSAATAQVPSASNR